MALFESRWLAQNRCGDWLVISEDDTYAVAYPDPCRRKDQERIVRLMAAAPQLFEALRLAAKCVDLNSMTLEEMNIIRDALKQGAGDSE